MARDGSNHRGSYDAEAAVRRVSLSDGGRQVPPRDIPGSAGLDPGGGGTTSGGEFTEDDEIYMMSKFATYLQRPSSPHHEARLGTPSASEFQPRTQARAAAEIAGRRGSAFAPVLSRGNSRRGSIAMAGAQLAGVKEDVPGTTTWDVGGDEFGESAFRHPLGVMDGDHDDYGHDGGQGLGASTSLGAFHQDAMSVEQAQVMQRRASKPRRLKLDLKDVSQRSKPGGGDGDESGTGVESGASTTRLVAPPCSPTGLELSPASGPSGGSDDRSDAETARELVAATSYVKLGPEEDISFSNTPRSPPPQRAASPADENDRALLDGLFYNLAKEQVITEAYDEVQVMLKRMNSRPGKLEDACEFSWPMPWFSFPGISRDNPLRKHLFQMVNSSVIELLFVMINNACCIFLILSPEMGTPLPRNAARRSLALGHEDTWDTERWFWLEVLDHSCLLLFAFEIVAGTVVYGFRCPGGWWRHTMWNKIDMVILFIEILEFASSYSWLLGITFRPLRICRNIKVLTRSKSLTSIKLIMNTLSSAVTQLGIVLAILALFMITFSIFGMSIYQKSYSRFCVKINETVPACLGDASSNFSSSCNYSVWESTKDLYVPLVRGSEESISIQGGYPFQESCKILDTEGASALIIDLDTYPKDPYGRVHSCQLQDFRDGLEVTEMCEYVSSNSMDRFVHFDHIGGALLAVFSMSLMDGFVESLHKSIESEPAALGLTWVLFTSVTCLCTWLVLGLFVAVVTDTYAREVDILQQSDKKDADQRKQDNELSDSDSDEDQETEEQIMERERQRMKQIAEELKKEKELQMKRMVLNPHRKDNFIEEMERMKHGATLTRQQVCHKLVNSNGWKHFKSFWIVLHCAAILVMGNLETSPSEEMFSYFIAALASCVWVANIVMFAWGNGSLSVALMSPLYVYELILTIIGVIGLILRNRFCMLLPSLRVYLLMVYFPTLYNLLVSALDSTSPIANLCVFLVVVGCTFSLTGRYIFGDQLNMATRSHYGNLGQASLTTFQLLTGDTWLDIVLSAIDTSTDMRRAILAVFYLVSWIIFATFVLTNIFIAVIIENFEVVETIRDISKPGYIHGIRSALAKSWRNYITTIMAHRRGDITFNRATGKYMTITGEEYIPGMKLTEVKKESLLTDAAKARLQQAKEAKMNENAQRSVGDLETKHQRSQRLTAWDSVVSMAVVKKVKRQTDFYGERSLYIFYPKDKFRLKCIWLSEYWAFQAIIIITILVNCFMMFVSPAYPDLTDEPDLVPSWISTTIDYVSTGIFTFEFVVAVISMGLIEPKYAYLKSGWNVLDTLVLLFSWFDLLSSLVGVEGNNLAVAKVFRLFRALRPLRLMKRNEGMRVVIDALIATLAPVIYVIVFSVCTYITFALIGMGLFGGRMSSCSQPGAEYPFGKTQCTGSHVDVETGVLFPRTWQPHVHHFDSLGESIVSLFMVGTIEYIGLMQRAMDATDIDMSPLENNSFALALFFVVYIIVGSLFVMNLFVGFIVDGFNLHKGNSKKEMIFNRLQRQFKEHRPRKKTLEWLAPKNAFSFWLSQFMAGVRFQTFSAMCVVVNVGFMLSDHTDPTPEFKQTMDSQNLFFFLELVAELFAYLCAVGPGGLVDDPWKNFDLFVCLGTLVGYLGNNIQITQFVKAFRLLRVVRLMIIIKKIRIILETLIKCIPQLANILVLLFLVYSMFAVLGVQAFSATKYGQRLGPTANFNTWTDAMQTCYQIVTGDSWWEIMDDCSRLPPECTPLFDNELMPGYGYNGPPKSFGDCGSQVSVLYFMAFKLICELIMLNLFIGMILENFAFITDEVSHSENHNWENGASADQIMEIAEIFQVLSVPDSKSGAVLEIESLLTAMNAFPYPVGHRLRSGERQFGESDRVMLRLVRAELNVIVMEARDVEAEINEGTWRGWWIKIRGLTPSSKPSVNFEDLMNTLVYWRKPDLVPEIRKLVRSGRIKKTIYVAHCLTMKDSMRLYLQKNKLRREAEAMDAKLGIKRLDRRETEAAKMANFSNLTNMISTKLEESQEAKAARLRKEKEKRRAERRLKKGQSMDGEFSRAGSADSQVSVESTSQTQTGGNA